MIVSLREKEGFSKYIEVLVDGEIYRTMLAQGFRRELKLPKEFSSQEEIDQWFFALEYKCAKKYVLTLLSKGHYPTHVLEKKLALRKISKSVREKILKECVGYGYIDNTLWLESFIRREFQKGWGPKALFLKLLEKGFQPSEFSSLLNSLITPDMQREKVQEILRRVKTEEKFKKLSSLQRKGFISEIIQEALDEIN